jgi:hypothetical protein
MDRRVNPRSSSCGYAMAQPSIKIGGASVISGGGKPNMPRSARITVVLCVLAASGSLCVSATSSVAAKHKPSVAAKHKPSVAAKHKPSVAAKHKRHKSSAGAKRKSSAVAKWETVTPTPRTPVDKYDCITVSQAFYGQATSLSSRTKQTIPQEFERVISKLDEFCGEEEFEKARISIDWMDTCLKNFTKDYKLGFCSRNKSYFCAIDPQSDGCQSQ